MTDAETAPTWILLRGLGREAGHWLDFRRHLAGVLPHRRIECIDWPGSGDYVALPSPCSIEAGVEHLRAVCRARALKPPYVLVGISMGGMASLYWLAHYPDEVAHAHVINTSVGGISYWYERMRPGAMLRLLAASVSPQRRDRSVFGLTTSLCRDRDGTLRRWYAIAAQRPVSRCNLIRQIVSAARFSQRKPEHAERLTLYVSGDDRLVSPMCSHDIARLWDVPLIEHPAAGHDLPLDDARWLSDQLLRGGARHAGAAMAARVA